MPDEHSAAPTKPAASDGKSDALITAAYITSFLTGAVVLIVEIAGTGITQLTLYPMPLAGQTIESVLGTFVKDIAPAVQSALSGSRA